jgi:ankyrin repeat protein
MTKNFASEINYLNAVKTVVNNFRHQFKELSTGLYKKDSDIQIGNGGDQSFDEIWIRDLPDQALRMLSQLQQAKYYKFEEGSAKEVDIQDQEIDKIDQDLMELLLQFIAKINNEDAAIDSGESRSAKTDRIINRIMDFRKFDQSLGKIVQSINEILPLEEQLSSSSSEAASDSEATIDSGTTTDSETTPSLDNVSISTKRSISESSLDSDKREEEEIKAKIKAAKIKARDHIISNLAEAQNELDISKKIVRYKDCLARAIEFTDQYFEDSTLLEVASAISLDKVAAEIFLYRDDHEVLESQTASPKISDVDQRQPEKTLFYKTLVRLDRNSQLVFIESMSKRDLKKLFLLLALNMEVDPKKQQEYQEIKEVVKIVELKQQDRVRESLVAAIDLRAEERKDALMECFRQARDLFDLYDNPAILVEVATAIFGIKQGNLITSDQLLIFRENPLSKIFEHIDDNSKQELLSKIPGELLHKLLLGRDDKIKRLLEKEVFKRQEQEKLLMMKQIESKLKDADQRVGKDKINTMVDYLSKVAEYAASYAAPQMVFRAVVLIDPIEQAAILSAVIDGKTLFHKVIASISIEEHRKIFGAISEDSVKELLPLVKSKSPEDKLLKDLLKEEQVKRDQEQKDKLAAKRQQELEETRKKIVAEQEEKRRQQEEARELQIKTEQQKQQADKDIRDGFDKISAERGEAKWKLAVKYLDLTVDFANKYGERNLFNQMLKLVDSFTPSDMRLIYKSGLDIQKTTIMFNRLIQESKTKDALELVSLLPDEKRLVILGNKDADGKTIFHKFAMLGQLELLTKAIEIIPVGEKSKILNIQDAEGKTALHYAAQRKNGIISSNGKKIASVLLENGGDANVRDQEGKTPLHYAAEKGRARTVNRMLQNTDVRVVDTMDNQGKTALHLAAASNNRTSAALLLKNGANPYLMDKQNKSVLEYGLEKGRKFFDLMTKKAKPEYKFDQDQQSETANAGFFSLLKTAIKSKVPNTVLKFLTKEKKFDLGVRDQDGNNALHLALKNADEETAKLLLKHGSTSIGVRNKDGKTARDIVSESDHPSITKIFDKTALTASENLRDLALKVKSESESDRKKFEEGYPMVLGILTQLNHSIAILKDKTNYKGTDEFLEKEMFGGALFYLGHYFTFSDSISSKKLHDLIGIKYQDNHMITQEDEQFQAAIKDSNKREKIIDFIEKFSEEFEVKARRYGLQTEAKDKLYKVIEEIAKAGDDLAKLEFNSDSNGRNIDRSAIFNNFSLKNDEDKIIFSYSKIDHHFKEKSPTSYQITIDPKKDEVLVLKNGEQSVMSFVDLSKLVENLEKLRDNLPEILKKLRKSKGGELPEDEIGDPSPDTHTHEDKVIHHTHKSIKEDSTVAQENVLNKE